MTDIVIFIPSILKDINRLKINLKSINKFNIDNIPIYIVVPDKERNIFNTELKDFKVNILQESEIFEYKKLTNGWYKQQLLKMNFWKLGISENMLQMDSDLFFIQPFYKSDFIWENNIPYTIMHNNLELLEFFADNNLYNSNTIQNERYYVNHSFKDISKKIRQYVFKDYNENNANENAKRYWDYGHPPCIWSNKVWESLYNDYIKPTNFNYEDLITVCPSEQQWYGEWLLHKQIIPIIPLQPLFKIFHYAENYQQFMKTSKIESIRYNYLGIGLQGNWCHDIEENPIYKYYSKLFL